MASVALLLVVAGPAPAADDPSADLSTCPSAGVDRATCLLARGHARTVCAPGSLETSLDKLLYRVAGTVDRAELAFEVGRLRPARAALKRTARLVQLFRARSRKLMDRGKLDPSCGAWMDALLAALHDTLTALRSGAPPTTTTSTTLVPGASTTTTVTTTSTTTTTVVTCGNGRLDPGEQCDGDNLFGRSCKMLGFTSGTLHCRSCLFDNSQCVR